MESPHTDAVATQEAPFTDGFTRSNGMRTAVPIVLGIVGHRDVVEGDRKELRARLVKLFKEFTDAYQWTPLVVVSSLAEGADQIAAEAALDAELGGRVFVRAPYPSRKVPT